MNEIKVKSGQYRGLTLWYNGENGHQYVMKIWRNFGGFSFFEYDEHDKQIKHTYHHFKVTAWDYNTAFIYLRDEFNLVK